MGRICHITAGLALLFSGILSPALAQDSVFVRKQISTLSSDMMYGRNGSHHGEFIAAQYIREQLLELGAQPLKDDGVQYYETYAHKMEGEVSMSANGKQLSPFWDYRIEPYSHSTHGKDIPVIRMDASLLLDAEKQNAFIEKNKETLSHGFLYIDAVKWKKQKDSDKEAVKKALRSLTYNNPFQSKGILIGVDDLPVWGLSGTQIQRNYAYIHVIRSRFPQKKATISVDFDNQFYLKKNQNICFKIQGTEHPDELIVMMAHYDHLGSMGDSVIFHGAHDNASGTSAVLDFARHYSANPPAYTTVFLLFSGEESGLLGSKHFVENPWIDFSKVKLAINLDMFCGGDEGITMVNYDSEGTREFYDQMVRINNEKHLVAKVNPRVNAANSDHYFFSQKCPALFIYTMGGRYGGYHHFTDTSENCGLECYNNIFTLIKEAIESIR